MTASSRLSETKAGWVTMTRALTLDVHAHVRLVDGLRCLHHPAPFLIVGRLTPLVGCRTLAGGSPSLRVFVRGRVVTTEGVTAVPEGRRCEGGNV